jgi:hypothetical protein
MDLLKACQREGLVRLERDRRGGLRVFQGSAMQRPPMPPPIFDVEQTEAAGAPEAAHADVREVEVDGNIGPIPVDTTAELLGRAKPRRPRSRLGARAPEEASGEGGAAPTRARKPAARKSAPRRARSRKSTPAASDTTE